MGIAYISVMAEILAEADVRDRNVITIPSIVRDILNISIGSRVRFESNDSGDICFCRVVSHKVNNRCSGDVDD